jgi:hypothetical protein
MNGFEESAEQRVSSAAALEAAHTASALFHALHFHLQVARCRHALFREVTGDDQQMIVQAHVNKKRNESRTNRNQLQRNGAHMIYRCQSPLQAKPCASL